MHDIERAAAVIDALLPSVTCEMCGLMYRQPNDVSGFLCFCGWMLFVDRMRPCLNVYRPDLLWN